MLTMAKTFIYQMISSMIRNIGGSPGNALRRFFYKMSGVKLGKNVIIRENVMIYRPYNLELGDNTELGFGTVISAVEKIKIGKNVAIGPFCAIYDNNHKMPKGDGDALTTSPVEIDSDSWIGTHAIILQGVKIGRNVTVGAGSVVMNDLPDNAVAIGNPARVIKKNPSITKGKS